MTKTSLDGVASSALISYPLLKFPLPDRRACLQEEGLNAIRALSSPIHVATITGDARCGKSLLSSAVATRLSDSTADGGAQHSGSFRPCSHSGIPGPFRALGGPVPVTAGIDFCIVPLVGGGSLVLLDCEGSNSPIASVSSSVDVLAMLCSTLTLQVVWGQLGNHQLDQLGSSLARRDILPPVEGERILQIPQQKLLLVANGDHLGYGPDDLEQIFSCYDANGNHERRELRTKIRECFCGIRLLSVPFQSDPERLKDLTEPLCKAVLDDCAPLSMGGVQLAGNQTAELMNACVEALKTNEPIPVPSIFRYVVFDQFLKPKAAALAQSFKAGLPRLKDYEPCLQDYDSRSQLLQYFDEETGQISHKEMVCEARSALEQELTEAWRETEGRNAVFGDQVRDITTEFERRYLRTEEKVVDVKKCCMIGPKRPVIEWVQVFRYVSRMRKVKRNGDIEYTEWLDTGRITDDKEFPAPSDLGCGSPFLSSATSPGHSQIFSLGRGPSFITSPSFQKKSLSATSSLGNTTATSSLHRSSLLSLRG